MKALAKYGLLILLTTIMACKSEQNAEASLEVEVYETSQKGNQLTRISDFPQSNDSLVIQLRPEKELQTIIIYKADQGLVEYKFYKSTTENQTAC